MSSAALSGTRSAPAITASTSTPASASAARASRVPLWAGRILTALVGLFLLADAGGRLAHAEPYIQGLLDAGYPLHTSDPIGLALLVSCVLYLVPRTAVLGAILLTGYLGGATATQVRLDDPWFLFPVAFGVLVWLGLFLRDRALRSLLPVHR
jgi:hypothetical protein